MKTDDQEFQDGYENLAQGEDSPVFEMDVNPAAFNVDIEAIASLEDEDDPNAPEQVIDNKTNADDQPSKTEPVSTTSKSEEEKEDSPSAVETGEGEGGGKSDKSEEEGPEPSGTSKSSDEQSESEGDSDIDEKYKDYSESALIAISEIKDGTFPLEEDDIPKDLDALTLRQFYRKHTENQIESIKEQVYNQAGEASEFVKFLMEGGDPRAVERAASNQDLINVDLDSEENQRKVLKAQYSQKGLPEEDVNEIVESIFDKGKNVERSQQAQNELKEQQKTILQEARKQQEELERQQQERQKEHIERLDSLIEGGEIGGYKLDSGKKKELREALHKPTEIVEIPNPQTGQLEKKRATKAQALQLELNKNPEKYLAFNLWLLEGGNFDFAKSQAVEERDDDFRSLLERRQASTKPSKKKLKSSGNGWQDLAERVGW